jgi:protein-tyrosine-phosphatase
MLLPPHEPHSLDELGDDYFDLIVALAPEAHEKAMELARGQSLEVEYWPMPDPSQTTGTREQILDAYRTVRDKLETKILTHFEV